MRRSLAWALRGPSGKIHASTVASDRGEAWAKAYAGVLCYRKWMSPYWKMWGESIAEANRRGWRIVRIQIEEIEL